MLDGLLGRGFSSKCKSSIKLTRTRLDAIKRKRNAMQKYLTKDIADLLANGLDINAYGRAEGLSVELILSSCYDFVEQFCECVLKHLSAMQKQRECPEECREAVSSLMFAAARFADLPELRELRDNFTERYGRTLESFANKEFVENLSSKPPTLEKRLKLMREIAQEFSIRWDLKAFEQKINNPPLPAQEPPKRQGSFNDPKFDEKKICNNRNEMPSKRENREISSGSWKETVIDRDNLNAPSNGQQGDIMSHRRWEHADDRYKQHKVNDRTILERDDQYKDDGFKPRKGMDHTSWKRENHDILSQHECNDDGVKIQRGGDLSNLKRDNLDNTYHRRRNLENGRELHNRREDTVARMDKQDITSHREQDFPALKQKMKIIKEDAPFAGADYNAPHKPFVLTEKSSKGAESMKPLPPPPYTKPNGGKYTTRYATSNSNEDPAVFPANDRSERTQVDLDCVENDETRVVGPARTNGHNNIDRPDDLIGEKKPKPKSVRRKHLKPPPGQDYRGNEEGDVIVKRHPNGRRREDMRQGLQHALANDHDSKDKEERMMDKLLIHYSKKPTVFEPKNVRGPNAAPGHLNVVDAGEQQRHNRKGVAYLDPEPVPPPSRAISLPPEPAIPTGSERVPARATSFQPEMLNPGGHVHPRLPDYDDLAARFAALRGR